MDNIQDGRDLQSQSFGYSDRAKIKLSMALRQTPNDFELYIKTAGVYRAQNHLEQALMKYKIASIMDPKSKTATLGMRNVLLDLDRYEESISLCQKLLEQNPSAILYGNLGYAFAKLNRYEDAIAHYQKALELDKSNPMRYCEVGNMLRRLENYDEAIKNYQKALQLNPKSLDALNDWAVTLYYQQKYEEAAQKCSEAAKIEPRDTEICLNWGLAYYQLGKKLQAVEMFGKVVETIEMASSHKRIKFRKLLDLEITRLKQRLPQENSISQTKHFERTIEGMNLVLDMLMSDTK